MFWGAMAMWTIERFGRRRMMLFGASGCSACFAIVAIGLGVNNKASNGVAVAFIFIFYFFFVRGRPPSDCVVVQLTKSAGHVVHGHRLPLPE